MDFLDFFSTKVISAVRFDPKFGFVFGFHEEAMKQNFVCNIRYGDLLKDSGDILLCPVSEGFIPSNPFSRKVLKAEGKWLNKKLKAIYDFPLNGAVYADSKYGFKINESGYIGTKHAAFLSCKKLKYRGIIFVAMDFYSKDREENNASRMAEAMELAVMYNCRKLSCPQGFLYARRESFAGYDYLFQDLEQVLKKFKPKSCMNSEIEYVSKINFVMEFVIEKSLASIHTFENTIYLPECSEILPWYRKTVKGIRTVYSFSDREAKTLRKILTSDSMNKKRLFRVFRKLKKKLGNYYETGAGRCNEGFAFYLLRLCNEMPWMFNQLVVLLKEFYREEKYDEGLDEFIFKERFDNLEKFQKRLVK